MPHNFVYGPQERSYIDECPLSAVMSTYRIYIYIYRIYIYVYIYPINKIGYKYFRPFFISMLFIYLSGRSWDIPDHDVTMLFIYYIQGMVGLSISWQKQGV